MHAAVLYNRDRRFAGFVLEGLRREPGLVVAENRPYFVSDETDYTIPRHGESARSAARGDRDPPGSVPGGSRTTGWAQRITRALQAAERAFYESPGMSQRIGRGVDCMDALFLPGSVRTRIEMQDRSILPKTRATLEDDPAPGRAQCAIIAADNLPLGHNC